MHVLANENVRERFWIGLLLAVAALVYANTLTNDFAMDDIPLHVVNIQLNAPALALGPPLCQRHKGQIYRHGQITPYGPSLSRFVLTNPPLSGILLGLRSAPSRHRILRNV